MRESPLCRCGVPPGFRRQVLPARRRSRPEAAIVALLLLGLVGGAARPWQHVIDARERPDQHALERIDRLQAEIDRMWEVR